MKVSSGKKTDTAALTENEKKIPILFSDFYYAFFAAVVALLDADAPCPPCEACYAVVRPAQAVRACTLFFIAACSDYALERVEVKEEAKHIVLALEMRRRHERTPIATYAPFVRKEDYLRFFSCAKETDLSLTTVPTETGIRVRFSFVRFLADEYCVASFDGTAVADHMYQTILDYNGL